MPFYVTGKLSRIAKAISEYSDKADKLKVLKDRYNLTVDRDSDPEYINAIYDSIQRLPSELVKDCKISKMRFEDLGHTYKYYPNHGKYSPADGTLTLNFRIIDEDLLIIDPKSGSYLNKFDQTFYHELGHGWDHVNGKDDVDLSLQKEWMCLSGWSKTPIPGHKRIIIREPGTPILKGEYYYDSNSGFTRFYAKRNPFDDFADSFAYYVADMKSFLPEEKIRYLDKYLLKYYKK